MKSSKPVICLVVVCLHLLRVIQCLFSPAPETVITFVRQQMVQFTCGIDSGHLIWEVDGIEARLLGHRNITFLTQDLYSTLSIEASVVNNNSEILCIQSLVQASAVLSAPAYLYVQGLLQQPANLVVVTRTYMSIGLEWTPPFTLNITQHEPDILHYIILLTKTVVEREEHEEIMTTNSVYTYDRKDFSSCSKLTFQVAAVNQVGRGNLSEMLETSFLGPAITVNPANKTVQHGERAHFSCSVLCSKREIVVWFINESIVLPSVSPREEDFSLIVQGNPQDTRCGSGVNGTYTESLHNVFLQTNNRTGVSSNVYCAVLSICDRSPNCSISTCYSNNAYLHVVDGTQPPSESRTTTVSPSHGRNLSTTQMELPYYGSTSGDAFNRLLYNLSLFFGVAFTGTLLVLIIIIVALISCRLRRQHGIRDRSKSNESPAAAEVIYDELQTPSTSPLAEAVVLNRCPAYATRPCK